jgi:3-oxoacyl-[acyl-carrier protein] reductase
MALVFDATGIADSTQLVALHGFFHPTVRRVRPSGRVVVVGTPPRACVTPREATAQRALEGFTRALGKEIGRGATVQLVAVAPGAENQIESTLRFLLSPRSAYVSGQVVRIEPSPVHPELDWERPLLGRVALVTGAARGIGAAIAEDLARLGWPVGVNYSSDADGASAVVARIEAAGGRATALQGDVSDEADVDAVFDALEDRYGPVLVLVNNAGTRHDRLLGGLDPESWSRVLDVNLTGAFLTSRRAIGKMVRRRFGRVVNVSSISASQALPGQSSYAASKAGLEALTRTVAVEVARRGVTVNAVAPGVVDTGFLPDSAEEWMDSVPAKRPATAAEVAALVRFLVSEEAGYVNGAVVRMDGGLLAGVGVVTRKPRAAAGAGSSNE